MLREAFDCSYHGVAEALGTSEANARQLASKARRHLASQRSPPTQPAEQRRLVRAFLAAARDGDLAALEQLLTEHVTARTDGGGRIHASRKELHGVARVTNLVDNVLRKYWRGSTMRLVEANGGHSLLVATADGVPQALVALDTSDRGIEGLLLVVNPDKLRQFTAGA